MDEREGLLILNAVPGLGNAGIRKLLDRYGSAGKILTLSEPDLLQDPRISPKAIEGILEFPRDKFLKAECDLIRKMQAKVVTFRDDDYPAVLRSIADAPVVLYVKGQLPTQGAIAIVGSRRASFYGIEVSAKFAVRLAESDFTVVSGMARGIDAAAHRGALRAKGTTVAVLGSGLSNIYPPEHRKLFEEIAASGAVISEFAMQTPPVPYNFPRRNRIISGLSLGVIVVEAAERSGALITADFALEQGREVFAVPGKIDQASSFGTHNLIKQGAKIVTCVEDVLEDLQPQVASLGTRGSKNRIAKMPMPGLSADEQKIYGYISDRPVHIDELTEQCGSSVPVMSVLLQLEIKHLVRQLPGKLFVR